jgi:hypothetical protein
MIMNKRIPAFSTALLLFAISSAQADQKIQDDLVVVGSGCFGFDCVNGESFSFDTLRLKENNLRIKFQDTSSSSSFPTGDWQITINDAFNGGTNYFAIEDIDAVTVPFTIFSGAPNHSLYLTSSGNIGLGTTTPLVGLQLTKSNSPAFRLEQTQAAGFAAQAWDIGGNEGNFFVRDVTNGSKLPFRIVPNAPNNALYIAADGDIGFETNTPDGIFDIAHPSNANNHALLIDSSANVGINIDNGKFPKGIFDVQTTGGISRFSVATDGSVKVSATNDPVLKFEEIGDEANAWDIGISDTHNNFFSIRNRANPLVGANFKSIGIITLNNGSSNPPWIMAPNGNIFQTGNLTVTGDIITRTGNLTVDGNIATTTGNLTVDGDITTTGTVNGGSSRITKNNIIPINGDSILDQVSNLDIYSWSYIKDAGKVTHIGPMAEEFYETFNVGIDNKHISPTDTSGISLAAIKALMGKIDQQDAKIAQLEANMASSPPVLSQNNHVQLDSAGNMTLAGGLTLNGTLALSSDSNMKDNILGVDTSAILASVASLAISSWNYKTEGIGVQHVGPMAQDFKARFGLGQNDTTLSTLDLSGVALASIQELNKQVAQKDDDIAALTAQVDTLSTQLSAVEAMVRSLIDNQ